MNPLDALRLMVLHYGREEMARKLNKPVNTLDKELQGAASNKLGVVEACYISALCIERGSEHCYAFVNLVAASGGRLVELPLRASAGPATDDVSGEATRLIKESSDVLIAASRAMANHDISDNEKRRIKREIGEVVAQAQALGRAVDARHAASKRGKT